MEVLQISCDKCACENSDKRQKENSSQKLESWETTWVVNIHHICKGWVGLVNKIPGDAAGLLSIFNIDSWDRPGDWLQPLTEWHLGGECCLSTKWWLHFSSYMHVYTVNANTMSYCWTQMHNCIFRLKHTYVHIHKKHKRAQGSLFFKWFSGSLVFLTCFWHLYSPGQMVLLNSQLEGSGPEGKRACPPLAPQWPPLPQFPLAGLAFLVVTKK